MSEKQTYNFLKAFQWVYSRISKKRRKQFWFLFFGMLCTAFLETVALGSIAFFASTVTDPKSVLTSKYFGHVKEVVNTSIIDSPETLIVFSGLIMAFFIVLKNSIKAIAVYGMTLYSSSVEADFGKILFDGVLRLPYQWHMKKNSADIVNAIGWREFFGRRFLYPFLTMMSDTLMVVIMLLTLFLVQPMVSSIVIVILGGSAFYIYKQIRSRLDRAATKTKNYRLSINKQTTMAIHGIKDVKISQKEASFFNRFIKDVKPLTKTQAVTSTYAASPELILESIGFFMLILAIFVMIIKFDVTTAYMTSTMALLAATAWKALPAVSRILNSVTKVRSALPYIDNEKGYFEAIESLKQDDPVEVSGKVNFQKAIEFEGVCFSYDESNTEAIKDISFEICKGETVGIIGASGAGKSTLVDLLIGLLTPVKGSITLDGKELMEDVIYSWQKAVGYVSQSPFIYDGTLAKNVAFGIDDDKIDFNRVRECCTMASMDDFVNDLPEKINTKIGERGVRLSGGQQQRVAIARALYDKPEVMIFDEATSSLDRKAEKSIQKTIYSFKGKQTLIIIAHRLATVRECDKVLWLEKGKFRMIGKASDVLAKYTDRMGK